MMLSEMLPNDSKHNFLSSFDRIQHLLKDDQRVSIYHTSFSDFINTKTQTLNQRIHDNVSTFIKNNPETGFSIAEKIYHLVSGDQEHKTKALEECNQTWIDECALNSINPDIVLADVRTVIGYAAKLGIAPKVISLLLLSQRISFRYNILFNENAFFLVNALLALNKPDEAIRYVVRNKALIVADGDALYLLQRFYEYEANEEAEILLNAINQVCRNIIETGLDSASFERFIHLKFSAITLSCNKNHKQSFEEFSYYKECVEKMIEENGNSDNVVEKFKNDIGSYNIGYTVWRFNSPPLTKFMEEFNPKIYNDRMSGFIALSIYESLEFQEKSPKTKTADNIPAWIEDLEYIIDKYGTHADYHFVLLYVMLGKSKRIDIIEELFHTVYPEEESFDFRKENGVDLNHQAIQRYSLYAECLGFFDTTDSFPELSKYGYYSAWEGNLKRLLKHLCFLIGKIKRCTVEGKEKDIATYQPTLVNLLEKLIPDLRERTSWKRSYALPELIFPVIYKKVIHLLIDAFSEHVAIFVDQIEARSHYQLGLYNEGYIDSLFVIGRELSKKANYTVAAFKVIRVLDEHVIKNAENRWERNQYLLRLVELYAFLKNADRAEVVFREMIDTSMGPSWYKEAQLGIINTAVSNILPKNGNLSYLQKFAAHLHHASGELTFQRYVKQQQEDFVGDLAKVGFLQRAIDYFKYLLLPDYKTVITNAESGTVDMPCIGDGYVLGARAIEEQSGVLDLLRNLDCKGSLIAWGLTELCILGDDRYIWGYAKKQAEILNYLEKTELDKVDLLLKRVSRFVVTELDDEFRYDYLRELFKELSEGNFERAKPFLEAVGMKPAEPRKESEKMSSSKEREDPLDKLIVAKAKAQIKLDTENKSGARKIIVEALHEVQNDKYGIWSSNYSHKIDDIRNLLSETYTNSTELIKDLHELIINEPYFEEWVIANQLIKLLRNIGDEHEKQQILSAVIEHIDLMVRTPTTVYERYGWLNNLADEAEPRQQEQQLMELIIWFLNLPSIKIKNRTIEILAWLGSSIPKVIVPGLFKEMLSPGYHISKELSAAVIHQISDINPKSFWEVFKISLEENEEELIKLNHFMIRDSLIHALRRTSSWGINEVDTWIKKFERTFPTGRKKGGEVILEEEYLEPISNSLYQLNDMKILTRQFAEILLSQITTLAPCSIEDSEKASLYIDRSFNDHNDISLVSDYDTILRYALNVAITSVATIQVNKEVAAILRFYQPTFPENYLSYHLDIGEEGFEMAVKTLFETGAIEIESLLIKAEVPLNYYSEKFSESRSPSGERVELKTYLIPIENFDEQGHSYPWPTFSANDFPDFGVQYDDEKVIPLIINSENATNVTGGDLVPAVVNTGSKKVPQSLLETAKTIYWRKGRNWEQNKQGVAKKTGYYTTVSKDSFYSVKGSFKIIWQVHFNHKVKYIDVFENSEIR